MEVTVEAIQIMGGYGYMKEYPVEKNLPVFKAYLFSVTERMLKSLVLNKPTISFCLAINSCIVDF